MENKDIRWQQRFANYKKALAKLGEVAETRKIHDLSELEQEGLIQRFEYTYELAWETLQDLLREKGYLQAAGPNSVIAQAYEDGYITDDESWKKMKLSRELTAHTYNAETAEGIAENIIDSYYRLLKNLEDRLEAERNGKQTNMFDA